MNFNRKIYKDLLAWKHEEGRIPLIIKGLRQTGKTTIAFAFANIEYENAFYVDFRQHKRAHSFFDGDFNIDTICSDLTTLPRDKRLTNGDSFVPGKTLIIFDEIQDCPNARSSLKYFKEDGRYDVLCTGSMLGINGYRRTQKPGRGIGVGSEEYLTMYPMDFEEFLVAVGVKDENIASLRDHLNRRKGLSPYMHSYFTDLFRQYMIVGGMPEAVSKFVETRDYQKVRKTLRRILSDYESDFGTHLKDDLTLEYDDVERALIGEVFRSIPRQLAKENKKFQFSVVKPNGKMRTYGFALQYLEDFGLIKKAVNLSALEYPFEFFTREDQFKVYLVDTGLLIAMLDDEIPSALLCGELGIGKGMIYENIFADAYAKRGKKLYYYRKDSGLEIDFIDSFGSEVTLIEIKAKSGSTKASATVLADSSVNVHHLVRITASNVGWADPILNIPHYMTHLLADGFRWSSDD